jgi:hypothetical protein
MNGFITAWAKANRSLSVVRLTAFDTDAVDSRLEGGSKRASLGSCWQVDRRRGTGCGGGCWGRIGRTEAARRWAPR